MPYIIAFLRSKGISFDQALDLPEYEFEAMFFDLGNTTLGEIVRVRVKKKKGEALTEEEIELYNLTMFKLTEEEEEEKRRNKLKAEAEEMKVAEAIKKMNNMRR